MTFYINAEKRVSLKRNVKFKASHIFLNLNEGD